MEAATPIGPVVVTLDELGSAGLDIGADVDCESMQRSNTGDLVFCRTCS